MEDAPGVRYAIRRATFTGYCYRDRLVNRTRRDRLPRLPHPAVDWSDTVLDEVRQPRRTLVAVTCPTCGVRRYLSPGAVADRVRAGRFSGLCLQCSPNAHVRTWTELSPGRKVDPVKGYIRLGLAAIPEEDRRLWDAMRGRTGYVHEHRYVMAKALGRPLTSNELVDHMDGDKTNNDSANLRLYRRGRNDPGDTNGYGTFYHEWQMALAEIRRLTK